MTHGSQRIYESTRVDLRVNFVSLIIGAVLFMTCFLAYVRLSQGYHIQSFLSWLLNNDTFNEELLIFTPNT